MSHLRLKYLLDKYLSSSASAEEEEELFDLLALETFDDSVRQYLLKAYYKSVRKDTLDNSRSEKMLSTILNKTDSMVYSKKIFWKFSKISWAAAILMITSGLFFLYNRYKNKTYSDLVVKHSVQPNAKHDVAPGSNGAILKLADGSQVVIDSNSNKRTIRQGNSLVVSHGSSLDYINNDKSRNEKGIGYNLVETQRGQQFHLSLEDGTKVWLNASSTISFPIVFSGNDRDVKVTGEVYFEVAKNKRKPFRVFVDGSVVEVLGTHFNINSYGDNGTVNTTLLEGSVKISNGDNHRILKPGDQARVRESGGMTTVRNINTDDVVAWKNNFFSFDDINIKSVMMQLSRWYDVKVEFEGKTDESVTFNGAISRSVNLSTVLKMLESTGVVKFSITAKKVTVSM